MMTRTSRKRRKSLRHISTRFAISHQIWIHFALVFWRPYLESTLSVIIAGQAQSKHKWHKFFLKQTLVILKTNLISITTRKFNYAMTIISSLITVYNNFLLLYYHLHRNQIHRDNAGTSAANDPFVPIAFVDLLRVALAKMIGSGWLHPELGGIEFWNKFPVKYSTVRSYERTKVFKKQ